MYINVECAGFIYQAIFGNKRKQNVSLLHKTKEIKTLRSLVRTARVSILKTKTEARLNPVIIGSCHNFCFDLPKKEVIKSILIYCIKSTYIYFIGDNFSAVFRLLWLG